MYNEDRLDPELAGLAPMFANFINLDDIPAMRPNLAAMRTVPTCRYRSGCANCLNGFP